MQLKRIAKSLLCDSTILLTGCCISVALLYSLSAYTKKEEPQQELLTLTFSSWNPEQKKPVIEKEKKKVVEKTRTPKKNATKPKLKPNEKPQKVLAKTSVHEKPITKLTKEEKNSVPIEEEEDTHEEEILPIPTPVFQLTNMPKFLHKDTPEYPVHLKNSGKEGIVKLQLLIDDKGNVRKVSVLKSAGNGFDNAAMRAMYKSTFVPAKVNNRSVAVLLTMPVKFRLM